MAALTTITRPSATPTPSSPVPISNDEITYPHFRLLNRQTRVTLSALPFQPDVQQSSPLFVISNTRGWFAAVIRQENAYAFITSPLSDLRTAAANGQDSLFAPSRSVHLGDSVPCMIAFALNDSRLVVALASGELLVYDTAQLFTPGQDQVQPIHAFRQAFGAKIRHVLPNPNSTDVSLGALVAVVLEDGRVLLLNVQTLGEDGGWAAGEEASRPVTVSWSPKGKHLAIGLLTGEILTFSLTEKSKPHKVIPSAASLPLSSLHWLAPGHTFQTTYASPDDPQCHIVTLDVATSNVSSTSLTYPFPLPDRPQRVLNVLLPNWDFPQGSGSKSLVIFGDVSSTDVEVFGHADKWDQKSRDDADISLPLDKNSDDTFLVGMDVDLTSSTPAPSVLASGEAIDWPPAPILFAYLNDGTIQAWHITQATPYVGMIASSGVPPVSSPAMLDIPGAGVGAPSAPEQDMLTPSQTVNPKTETVDMSEAMMTTNTSMGMGMGEEPIVEMSGSMAASTPTPTPQQANVSTFGQTQTGGFGQPSVISKPLFGQGSFGQGSFGPTNTSASNTNTNTNPISGGFGAFASGQSSFGFGNTSAPNITKAPSSDSIPSDDMHAEMTSDSGTANSNSNAEPKLAFGGLSFGGPPPAQEEDKDKGKPVVNSMFGSATAFGAPSTFGGSSAFGGGSGGGGGGGGLIKPATAFGASSATPGNGNASETPSSLFSAPAKPANTSSTFGQSSFGQSPFGQPSSFGQPSAFGQSSFGQPSAFGQSSFGHTAFGKPAFGASSFPAKAPTAPSAATVAPASGGGFASFAHSNATFGKPSIPATGNATPSTPVPSATPASGGGFASFAQSTATFGKPSTTTTGSATPSTPTPSVFSPPTKGVITPSSSPETPMKDTAQTSALSSPDSPVPVKPATTPFSTPSQPSTSSSAFKPASGFGAFGSSSTPSSSPFFKTPNTPASQGAFASLGSPSPSPFSTPTFGASTTPGAGASPGTKFGVSSALGTPSKSVFGAPSLPTSKPNEGGAFSAFSGGGSAFTSFAGPQKSFKDLLSAGGSSEKTETKPQSVFSPKEEAPKKATPVEEAQPQTPSKPATPSPDDTPQPSGPASPETIRNESKPTSPSDGQSLSSLSFSSTSSSFVEVTKPDGGSPPSDPAGPNQVNDASSDEEGELDNDDGDSFVSESFSSDPEDDNDHENSASESLPSEGESDAEEEDQEEEEEDAQVTEPADIGLRSPSATPTAEAPSVSFSKSPTPTPNLSLNLDTSTTPPGSPEKQSTLQTPLPAPVPVITLGSSSPTPGLSSGRPSTRPARSSPLAKAPPLSGEPESPSLSKESAEPVKPSTPPIQFKPRPASPKGVFGAPAAKSQVNAPVFSARPMTPPLSAFDTGKAHQSSPALNPVATPATPATPGIKLPASFSFSNTTPASSPFGQSSAPSPFGAPAPPAFPSSPSPFAASPLGAPSGFSGFGAPAQPKQPPAPSAFNPPPPPRQAPTIEDGMQAECMRLFSVLGKELEELKIMSQMATKQREDFAKSSGTHSKADLRTPEKWGGLNDVVPFGKAMKTLESDVKQKKQLMLKEQDFLRDIQDSMLKAGTRKEEIARFNRAKNDADFSQMLKSRTLGPEHHETQVHLRKSIRDIRDRVSKLEQTLQTSKSKLSRSNKGKPVLKPPSLATAHRTLQNIDIAIHQQATEIAGLSSRFARLDISSLGPSNPLLRSRLQYGSKQHAVATPNVAVTTAAALNSERSTHRLKDRLLRTRKEPLLNNKVTPPSHAPLAFSTPRASTTSPMPSITFTPPAGGGADFSPGAYSPTPSVRRGAAFASKHYKSPAIKKAPEQQTPSAFAPPAGFSWGPVPSFPPIKPLAAPIIPLKSPHTP